MGHTCNRALLRLCFPRKEIKSSYSWRDGGILSGEKRMYRESIFWIFSKNICWDKMKKNHHKFNCGYFWMVLFLVFFSFISLKSSIVNRIFVFVFWKFCFRELYGLVKLVRLWIKILHQSTKKYRWQLRALPYILNWRKRWKSQNSTGCLSVEKQEQQWRRKGTEGTYWRQIRCWLCSANL